jgi:rSAM/selenodomain-associated transferase 2
MRGASAEASAGGPGTKPRLGIVAPVLDEAAALAPWLATLQPLRARGAQLVIVDGGSGDATLDIARARADLAFRAPRGRAAQMNAGAAACRAAGADVLLFLHADTRLPEDADALVLDAVARGAAWGRFDVRIDGPQALLRIVERAMNLRSRLTGIATGDQALFVRRDLFEAVGGFPAIPLMEDVALSRALKRHGRPACLRARVVTSARRWHRHGIWRTIFLMWRLRAAYCLGADPARLADRYGYGRRES